MGVTKRIVDLQRGDETDQFGVVMHREGRKVWFDSRIMTFPSEDDEVEVAPAADDR